jgi:uncharacterized protein YecE (DUF72 family)
MDVWIGTSGFSYPDWVGDFYPAGTRPTGMLPYYAGQFPLVELNYTFYRPPTADALKRLADRTPPGFQFLVKVPRSLSHERTLDDLNSFRAASEALQQQDRLLGVLCQLPQSAHNTKPTRAWLEMLGRDLDGLGLAVEFRHYSWATPETGPWLAETGADLVAVDAPDLPGLFPSGLVSNGPRAYVRLHSRNSGNWYGAGTDRYDYDYSDSELGEWVGALVEAGNHGTERTLLLFNNCHRSQAAHNARRMQELVGREAAHFRLVPPPVQADPVQRSLF